MSPSIDASAVRLAEIQANFDHVEKQGITHLTRLAPEIRALELPRGSYVIVRVATGAYVTGTSRGEALKAYRARHLKQPGWACRIEDLPGA